jgi:hypothetical protein
MALTIRASDYITVSLSANLPSVASTFITVATSLFIKVDLSMTFKSWAASSSFEVSTPRTHSLVVRPVAASFNA